MDCQTCVILTRCETNYKESSKKTPIVRRRDFTVRYIEYFILRFKIHFKTRFAVLSSKKLLAEVKIMIFDDRLTIRTINDSPNSHIVKFSSI